MNYLVQKLAFPAPNPSYDKESFKPQYLLTIPIEIGTIRREIPILCYKQREKCENWIIYFHGNAEDLYQAAQFVTELMLGLKVNAIAVEYPGYGIYPNQKNKDKDEIIEEDAIIVYNYVQQNLKVNPQNIYIIGRSIGTGPAFYTASTKECGGLIAISPYRSVNQSRGTWIDYIGGMSKSVFNNLQRSEKVKSKCLIIHGVNDQVIPIQNSKDIVNRMKSLNQLVVFEEIEQKGHNNLDVEYDIMKNIGKEFEQLKNLEFIQRSILYPLIQKKNNFEKNYKFCFLLKFEVMQFISIKNNIQIGQTVTTTFVIFEQHQTIQKYSKKHNELENNLFKKLKIHETTTITKIKKRINSIGHLAENHSMSKISGIKYQKFNWSELKGKN